MTQDNSTNTIAILQYNLRKNSSRTHSILSDPSSKKFTILMIQEQYWSDITESTPVHRRVMDPHRINLLPKPQSTKRNIHQQPHLRSDTSSFRIITFPFPDITAVAINTKDNSEPTLIINIYNRRKPDHTSNRISRTTH